MQSIWGKQSKAVNTVIPTWDEGKILAKCEKNHIWSSNFHFHDLACRTNWCTGIYFECPNKAVVTPSSIPPFSFWKNNGSFCSLDELFQHKPCRNYCIWCPIASGCDKSPDQLPGAIENSFGQSKMQSALPESTNLSGEFSANWNFVITFDIITEMYRHFIPEQVEVDSFNLICRQFVPQKGIIRFSNIFPATSNFGFKSQAPSCNWFAGSGCPMGLPLDKKTVAACSALIWTWQHKSQNELCGSTDFALKKVPPVIIRRGNQTIYLLSDRITNKKGVQTKASQSYRALVFQIGFHSCIKTLKTP